MSTIFDNCNSKQFKVVQNRSWSLSWMHSSQDLSLGLHFWMQNALNKRKLTGSFPCVNHNFDIKALAVLVVSCPEHAGMCFFMDELLLFTDRCLYHTLWNTLWNTFFHSLMMLHNGESLELKYSTAALHSSPRPQFNVYTYLSVNCVFLTKSIYPQSKNMIVQTSSLSKQSTE